MTIRNPSVLANGDINPAVFIRLDPSADHAVIQCSSATQRPFGISADASQDAPIPGGSTLAAAAGDSLPYFGVGQECTLTLGVGGCAAGDILVSDANGCGVVAAAPAAANQWVGFEALTSGAAGEKVRGVVRQYFYTARNSENESLVDRQPVFSGYQTS